MDLKENVMSCPECWFPISLLSGTKYFDFTDNLHGICIFTCMYGIKLSQVPQAWCLMFGLEKPEMLRKGQLAAGV